LTGRILFADDSPHAQRLGLAILSKEGFDVELVREGQAVYPALDHFDPDVVMVDVFLPGRSGYEICHWIKSNPRFDAMRVVLTAGMLEPVDENEAKAAGADAVIKKPFEASEVVQTIGPLVEAAQYSRGLFAAPAPRALASGLSVKPVLRQEPLDPEKIQAAVALAMEAALPAMIKEVTERVMIALGH
jgi:CheY-like chemotaxis protein